MMRTLRMSATLLVLLAATACGSRGTGGGSPAAPNTGGAGENSGSTVSSGVFPAPGSGPPTRANQAVPDSRAVDLRPVRWSRAEAGTGARLQIYYTVGGLSQCNVLGRVDVAETATTVTVTVQVGQAPGAHCGGAQPMIAAEYVTAVTLHEPLGNRTVKDGTT